MGFLHHRFLQGVPASLLVAWLIALRDSAAPEDNGLVSNHLHAEIAATRG